MPSDSQASKLLEQRLVAITEQLMKNTFLTQLSVLHKQGKTHTDIVVGSWLQYPPHYRAQLVFF